MSTRNTVSWNSIISACAKNNQINHARTLFDEMPTRNLVSWNTMIAGYLHNDQISEAVKLFGVMPRRDTFTWTLVITCYTRNGEMGKARDCFERMENKTNSACWNAMIAGYGKNGEVFKARKLFDQMPVRNLVSWNSMLAGYTQNGEMGMGLKFFEEMGERDIVSWNLMLHGFIEVGDMDSALEFFRRIPNPNVVSWVTMLSGYARNGEILQARRLFDRMPERNVVAWNAMIAGHCQNSQIDEALQLFKEMLGRNAASWTAMINGYVRIGKLDEARNLLNQMPYKNVAAQTALISGYVQNKRMDEARMIFDQIKARDIVSWNTMIAGYAQCGNMEEAVKLFKQTPKKNLVSWNTMISGYAQQGQMDIVVRIFEEMEQKNLVTWNSLISGFTQNGFNTEALEHFVLMAKEGKRPDQSSFASGLSACANLAALQIGKQIHNLAAKIGYGNDLFVGNALITMYSKCGRVTSAEQVFNDIDVNDIISWNALIAGYALNGNGKEAVQLFHEMKIKGLHPDQVTFVAVLSACTHSGLIDQGLILFKSMTEEHSIELLAEHYACVVDLLGRAGRLEEAYQLLIGMPIKANAGIWGALLGACRMHRNLELGKIAADKLCEFEPHKTSNYVLLSNIHAEAGEWHEVERVRILMKEKGGVKQSGLSWIEVDNQVYSFLSDNLTQLRTTEVSEALKYLTGHMRNKIYMPDLQMHMHRFADAWRNKYNSKGRPCEESIILTVNHEICTSELFWQQMAEMLLDLCICTSGAVHDPSAECPTPAEMLKSGARHCRLKRCRLYAVMVILDREV
ncbi:hypothetical protein IFM89_038787 [Coptis chinensis]|uniref:Pentatricopeptide repeat-containing protein n=1 Tax=Coptis chinensis TaxID=261450 RepID=A0A835MEF2_9MAGN|nr:hypothetical protein IFM89_038787 [Coptis chinensis]